MTALAESVEREPVTALRWEGPAISSEAVSSREKNSQGVSCSVHGAHCAFRGDESGRCPWCHAAWWSIHGRGHSCEAGRCWPTTERAWRVPVARMMRESAAENPSQVDTEPARRPVGADTGKGRKAVSPPITAGIAYVRCRRCSRLFGTALETVGQAECCGAAVEFLGAPEDHGRKWNDRAGVARVRKAHAAVSA